MSVAPGNNNGQQINYEESPADEVVRVETEGASYDVYKLGEDVGGYSDFAKGEVVDPDEGGYLLNLEAEKARFSLRPLKEGKAMEVYQPEDAEYSLVIQRTDEYSAEEVPERDKEEIRQTLDALD